MKPSNNRQEAKWRRNGRNADAVIPVPRTTERALQPSARESRRGVDPGQSTRCSAVRSLRDGPDECGLATNQDRQLGRSHMESHRMGRLKELSGLPKMDLFNAPLPDLRQQSSAGDIEIAPRQGLGLSEPIQ